MTDRTVAPDALTSEDSNRCQYPIEYTVYGLSSGWKHWSISVPTLPPHYAQIMDSVLHFGGGASLSPIFGLCLCFPDWHDTIRIMIKESFEKALVERFFLYWGFGRSMRVLRTVFTIESWRLFKRFFVTNEFPLPRFLSFNWVFHILVCTRVSTLPIYSLVLSHWLSWNQGGCTLWCFRILPIVYSVAVRT